jgi:MYXO-CTERM domain-containing protein
MRNLLIGLILLVTPLLASASVATVTLHNTGVDANDALVAFGEATSFWTLSAAPSGSSQALGSTPFRFRHPAYAADTSVSAWVSPGAFGNAGTGGQYIYDLSFDLTGFDLASVTIEGLFSSDNDGALWLNDEPVAVTSGFAGFGTMKAFSLTSGFVAGINVIHAMVLNAGDPTAFHVQFTNVAASPVPLPPPALLLTGALLALGARRRRKV